MSSDEVAKPQEPKDKAEDLTLGSQAHAGARHRRSPHDMNLPLIDDLYPYISLDRWALSHTITVRFSTIR